MVGYDQPDMAGSRQNSTETGTLAANPYHAQQDTSEERLAQGLRGSDDESGRSRRPTSSHRREKNLPRVPSTRPPVRRALELGEELE